MDLAFSDLNWLAIIASIIVGQIILTLWFTVLFGDAWAKAYGAANRAEHTKAVPGSTYGIGVACMVILVLGIALIQRAAGVSGIGGGLTFGIVAALAFGVATVLPGYGFLLKSDAGRIAAGSQAVAILVVSVILAAWQ